MATNCTVVIINSSELKLIDEALDSSIYNMERVYDMPITNSFKLLDNLQIKPVTKQNLCLQINQKTSECMGDVPVQFCCTIQFGSPFLPIGIIID